MPTRRKHNQEPEASESEIAMARRLLEASGHGTLAVGGPVRCADCSGWGMAGDFHPTTRSFAYACPSCRTTWTLSHAAVALANRSAPLDEPAVPVEVAPATPWTGPVPEAEAPVVRVSWGEGSATSGTGWAPRPAG